MAFDREKLTYSAWLGTIEDVERIRNFKFRDENGRVTGSIDEGITRVMGTPGTNYIRHLVKDLNQGVKTDADSFNLDKLTSNYKAAAVGANIRVIVQQPTAYLRAAAVIDSKYLAAGVAHKGNWELVKKWAPIAVWKDWGYFELDNGRLIKDIVLGTDSKLDKLRQSAMSAAGKADSITWGKIWNACELEIKDKTRLKPGTDEFYKAVAARFNEVIDQSQVVDGLLQRNQTMRSSSDLTRMATSFMAEPITSFSMLSRAVYDVTHATDAKIKKAAIKQLTRTAVAVAMADIVCAAVASSIDAMRDDDKDQTYWEKWIEAFLGVEGDESGFTDWVTAIFSGALFGQIDLLGKIPFFRDVASLIEGFDIKRMDMEAVSRFFSSAQTLTKALSGSGKYTLGNAFAGFFASMASLFGLPVANLKRDLLAMVDTAFTETGNYLLAYNVAKRVYSTANYSTYFYDLLYRAYKSDNKDYKALYDAMIKDGFEAKNIRGAIDSREKNARSVESVKDLDKRYLGPQEQKDYDKRSRELTSNSVWRKADKKVQDAAYDMLYGLVTGSESSAVKSIKEKAAEGKAYGISETEMVLLRVALEMYDENKNGHYDMAETQAAIDAISGLSQAERAYLCKQSSKMQSFSPQSAEFICCSVKLFGVS